MVRGWRLTVLVASRIPNSAWTRASITIGFDLSCQGVYSGLGRQAGSTEGFSAVQQRLQTQEESVEASPILCWSGEQSTSDDNFPAAGLRITAEYANPVGVGDYFQYSAPHRTPPYLGPAAAALGSAPLIFPAHTHFCSASHLLSIAHRIRCPNTYDPPQLTRPAALRRFDLYLIAPLRIPNPHRTWVRLGLSLLPPFMTVAHKN